MATSATQASNTKSTPFSEDPQRVLLNQLATLSVQATRDEARIEQEYTETMQAHRARIQEAVSQNEQKRQRNLGAINEKNTERVSRIEENFGNEMSGLEANTAKARTQAEEEKSSTDEALRKQIEQARWLAESVLEAVQTQMEVESRQAKQLHATRKAEIEQQRQEIGRAHV